VTPSLFERSETMRSERAYLLDILDAIRDIERYRPESRAAFDEDERTQVWMVNRLQIVGEASRKLSDEFRSRHDSVPWRAIIGMRHHLVHGYFVVDPDVVWSAITERVPELERQVQEILAQDPTVQDED
jgi:uncharacterized protein with HEPN domain